MEKVLRAHSAALHQVVLRCEKLRKYERDVVVNNNIFTMVLINGSLFDNRDSVFEKMLLNNLLCSVEYSKKSSRKLRTTATPKLVWIQVEK